MGLARNLFSRERGEDEERGERLEGCRTERGMGRVRVIWEGEGRGRWEEGKGRRNWGFGMNKPKLLI